MPKGKYKRKYTLYLDDLDNNFLIIEKNKDIRKSKIEFVCETCKKKIITSFKQIRRRIYENKSFLCQSCNKLGERNPSYNKNPYRNLPDKQRIKLKETKSINAKKNNLHKKGYLSSIDNKMSSIHKKIILILKDLKVKRHFVTEYSLEKYFFDEVSEKYKLIIEVHGDYWHANPNKYKKEDIIYGPWKNYTAQDKWNYDVKRLKYAKKKGYNVLVLWEEEINNNIDNIKNKIKKFILNHLGQ